MASIGAFVRIRREFVVVLALYAGLVWVAAYWLTAFWASPGYVAARALERNHLLAEDDLERPATGAGAWGFFLPDPGSLAGRYVTRRIDAGRPIDPGSLRASPDFDTCAEHRLVAVPLAAQPELLASLNPPAVVNVLPEPNAAAEPMGVHAVVCPDPTKRTTCYALLAVPYAREAAISARAGSLRLIPTRPPAEPHKREANAPACVAIDRRQAARP